MNVRINTCKCYLYLHSRKIMMCLDIVIIGIAVKGFQ